MRKDASKRVNNLAQPFVYLRVPRSPSKTLNCTPFSGRRHKPHAHGSTEECTRQFITKKNEADIRPSGYPQRLGKDRKLNRGSRRTMDKGECTHFPCIGSHIQATGWPDRLTAPICPGRRSSIWTLRFQRRVVRIAMKRKIDEGWSRAEKW